MRALLHARHTPAPSLSAPRPAARAPAMAARRQRGPAEALTIGADMVSGAGRFAPQTANEQALLAHELAHVVQQQRGGPLADTATWRRAKSHRADLRSVHADQPAFPNGRLSDATVQRYSWCYAG
jgi:hypothetical protein